MSESVIEGRKCGGKQEVWWQAGSVMAGRKCNGRQDG